MPHPAPQEWRPRASDRSPALLPQFSWPQASWLGPFSQPSFCRSSLSSLLPSPPLLCVLCGTFVLSVLRSYLLTPTPQATFETPLRDDCVGSFPRLAIPQRFCQVAEKKKPARSQNPP